MKVSVHKIAAKYGKANKEKCFHSNYVKFEFNKKCKRVSWKEKMQKGFYTLWPKINITFGSGFEPDRCMCSIKILADKQRSLCNLYGRRKVCLITNNRAVSQMFHHLKVLHYIQAQECNYTRYSYNNLTKRLNSKSKENSYAEAILRLSNLLIIYQWSSWYWGGKYWKFRRSKKTNTNWNWGKELI